MNNTTILGIGIKYSCIYIIVYMKIIVLALCGFKIIQNQFLAHFCAIYFELFPLAVNVFVVTFFS